MIALALMMALAGIDSDLSDPVPRQDRTSPYPRLDRRDRIGATDLSSIRFLPQSALPAASAGCDGASIVGTRGESTAWARASSAQCIRGNGLMLTVATDLPRVTNYGALSESTNTNLALRSRDLSNAAWTKTTMTCALDAAGLDGVASSASTCTASAGNGTVLEGLTVAAATRATSFAIKRVTGVGNVDLTRDNGSTWTTLTSTQCHDLGTFVATAINSSSFVRCHVASSVLNPTIGIRLVTNGDSVVVDVAQDEDSSFPTSPIITDGIAVARAAEVGSFSTPALVADAVGCGAAKVFFPFAALIPSQGRILAFTGLNTPIYLNSLGTQAAVYDLTNNPAQTITPSISARAVMTADLRGSWATGGVGWSFGEIGGVQGTGTFDGTVVGATTYFGNQSSLAAPLRGYISNVRLGTTATACDR